MSARISATTTKFQVGIAAGTVAAAATLTPMMAANAAPAVPLAPITHVVDNVIQGPLNLMQLDASTWWQNDPWWWVGQGSNPSPGAPILVGTFTPLSIIPGFLQDPWKRLTQNINFSACFIGAGLKVGPYGTVSVSLTRGC